MTCKHDGFSHSDNLPCPRVEELTAKLTEWQLVFGFIEPNEALDDCATKLATERAAREQAEERAQRNAGIAGETQAELQQAERERATALARVEELQHCCDRACQSRSQLTRLDISIEKAFGFLERTRVDIEAGKPEPSAALCLVWLSNCVAEQRKVLDERLSPGCCDAALAAETALASAEARVKELEGKCDGSCATDSRCPRPAAGCLDAIDDPPGMNDRQAAVHHYKRAEAAEAALASAREKASKDLGVMQDLLDIQSEDSTTRYAEVRTLRAAIDAAMVAVVDERWQEALSHLRAAQKAGI